MSVYRPKVYVTRRVPASGMQVLRNRGCEITQWDSDDAVPRQELMSHIRGIDALFCLLTDTIDKEVIEEAGSSLKVIGTMSVGHEHVDLAECGRRGIRVGYTPDVLTDATAELTIALLLTVARRLPEGIKAVKDGTWGTWSPMWLCGPTLSNSTVGIVGMGRIGFAVAQRLRPFGPAKILYANKSPSPRAKEVEAEFVDFDQLLQRSDFVIANCSLTSETKDLFDKNAFKKMKPSAIFINTSRGGVVQQEDLYSALKSGEIRAAGLDVTTPEPLPPSSPLLTLSNCTVLPHIASATEETRSFMSELTARNIVAALDDKDMPGELQLP